MNATLPGKTSPGNASTVASTAWPTRTSAELILEDLGLDPDVRQVGDLEHRLALGDVLRPRPRSSG